MWRKLILPEVRERIDALEIPFNRYGLDPYGISKDYLAVIYSLLAPFHRYYFRLRTFGAEHVPDRGRAMVVGNHSGGIPFDGAMVLASLFFDRNPPRHGHGMVEKFAQYWPFVSAMFSRIGQLPGLPEHAVRLLEADRLLLVFPEGARGIGKLYRDRYQMVRFGTGFMRIALETGSPIIPFGFVGGEEAFPTVFRAKRLARLVGAPYWPVPPYLVPLPMPKQCAIYYGEPMRFEGNGTETDEVIGGYVAQVKERINALIAQGREGESA